MFDSQNLGTHMLIISIDCKVFKQKQQQKNTQRGSPITIVISEKKCKHL